MEKLRSLFRVTAIVIKPCSLVEKVAIEKFIKAKTRKGAETEFRRMYPNAASIYSMPW